MFKKSLKLNQNKLCAVVVPLYKLNLSDNEILSIRQCFNLLSKYDIYFAVPDDDRAAEIRRSLLPLKAIATITFNTNYFKSISGYNRLMMSSKFYKAFTDYEYVLIYQTDAYVFSGNLDYWCEKGFDYIGAPWFKTKKEEIDLHKAFIGVGNGGFSLRKVSAMLKVLHSFKHVHSIEQCRLFLDKQLNMNFIEKTLSLIKSFTISNNFHHLLNNYGNNEDYFWGRYASKRFEWFKVPDMEDALKFSFEKRCEESFKHLNGHLPFGCHKWENENEIIFWKDYIK